MLCVCGNFKGAACVIWKTELKRDTDNYREMCENLDGSVYERKKRESSSVSLASEHRVKSQCFFNDHLI